MRLCISPIAPMLALIALEAAIVTALIVWVAMSWVGLASVGPMPEVILGAIVACGVIMALLPVARLAAKREKEICAGQAE